MIFPASSYSNQFRGDYELHGNPYHRFHHRDHFNDDSHFDSSVNSHSYEFTTSTEYPTTTTTYPMRYPMTPYFYPKDKTWDTYKTTKHKAWEFYPTTTPSNTREEINNEIETFDEEETPVFSYDENDEYGPSNWYKINRQCSGKFQSPIALRSRNTSVNGSSPPLTIGGIDANPISIKIKNNGHSMKISFNYPNNRRVRILGGPLQHPFYLDSFHWHWGKSDRDGSEHSLNFKRFSAEMHLIAYSSNYGKR